jgi:S1-C subfamily serine protease
MIVSRPIRLLLVVALAPLCLLASRPGHAAGEVPGAGVEAAVVKVFATVRYPDAAKPWTKQAPKDLTGSGVVIEGQRILTNAHVVLYASQVQVQANEAGDKLSATVLAVAPGIDLAVLKLDDDAFFSAHAPLPRASALPRIKDPVLAYGFPVGGTSLSITKGIVSRIEFVPYNYPVSGLRIQIDAAINPGNSGGPAVAGERMIGLAFSHLGGSENIGYIIPNEEIELFLADVAGGHYDGKPAMFDDLQTLENPALRHYLHLERGVQGMIVHRAFATDEAYPLREWDVVTHIGTAPIDDQGMVKIDNGLHVSFRYLVQKFAHDGKLPLTVVRGGKTVHVALPVASDRPALVHSLQGAYPSYFIYGPLVFSRASAEFIGLFGGNAATIGALGYIHNPLVTARGDPPSAQRDELVVVAAPFFPHKLAKGYTSAQGEVVRAVNGTPVRNFAHLVALLRDLDGEFVTFEFDQRMGETIVFPRAEMVAATEEILTDNGVRAQGSPDMISIWQQRASH